MRHLFFTLIFGSLVAAVSTATSQPVRVGSFWTVSDATAIGCHRGYFIGANGICTRKH